TERATCATSSKQSASRRLEETVMKLSTLAVLALMSLAGLILGISGSGPSEAGAKPVSYKLPNETATFKPGPNLELVQNNCTARQTRSANRFLTDFRQAYYYSIIRARGLRIPRHGRGRRGAGHMSRTTLRRRVDAC